MGRRLKWCGEGGGEEQEPEGWQEGEENSKTSAQVVITGIAER